MEPKDIVGPIVATAIIAEGLGIRELARLRKVYGDGNWKKKKGFADVKLPNGTRVPAEVHGYEAHGIGKREHKIKRILG